MSVSNLSVRRGACAGAALVALAVLAAALASVPGSAVAQMAHHPFAVGASEGAVGHQNSVGAWLLAQESRFYLMLTAAVRATRDGAAATATLVAISFAYGVFHAAGPGHGKAVIASYMVSNEATLRRGLVIAGLAALLQGFVATAIVGVAIFAFHATAARMTLASQGIEAASYAAIVALGAVLVWRKGRALFAVLRPARSPIALLFAGGEPAGVLAGYGGGSGRFRADVVRDGRPHDAACACGHDHMPDPSLLAGPGFDLRAAALAVFTAGARPCSGAILVLVFAASQGIFRAGVAAAFAMSVGTALTTGALACAAVFAKRSAVRLLGSTSRRALVAGRTVEFVAALAVLAVGLSLLLASFAGSFAAAGERRRGLRACRQPALVWPDRPAHRRRSA